MPNNFDFIISQRNFRDLMENYGHISKLDAIDFAFLVDRFDMNGDGVVTYPEVSILLFILSFIFIFNLVRGANNANPYRSINKNNVMTISCFLVFYILIL